MFVVQHLSFLYCIRFRYNKKLMQIWFCCPICSFCKIWLRGVHNDIYGELGWEKPQDISAGNSFSFLLLYFSSITFSASPARLASFLMQESIPQYCKVFTSRLIKSPLNVIDPSFVLKFCAQWQGSTGRGEMSWYTFKSNLDASI